MEAQVNLTGEETNEDAAHLDHNTEEIRSEETKEEQLVPLKALQSERSQRQKLEEELQIWRDNLEIKNSRREEPQKSPDSFEGLPDDDLATVGEIKKLLRERENVLKSEYQEIKISQKYPDYNEVINNYLPEVIKQKPQFAQTLRQTQDYEMAYYLAKNSDKYREEHRQKKQNADAQKIIDNSQRAGSLSSMGSVSPINEARRFKDMSDEEFRKEVAKNSGLI